MEIDEPDVVAEVLEAFERYEGALVANDLDVIDALMWHDHRTTRLGIDDRQDGWAAISAFRRRQARQTPPRTLRDTVVTTFGRDVAVVTTSFVPADGGGVGRQQQTWVRMGAAWQIVAAHVSHPLTDMGQLADQEP